MCSMTKRHKILIIAATAIAISTGTARAQDAQKGQMVFNMCLPCHSIGPGAQNKVGPELNGLDGRHSGSVPGFDYSEANKNSGIIWSEATFKKYIQNPQGVISGTNWTAATLGAFPASIIQRQIRILELFGARLLSKNISRTHKG